MTESQALQSPSVGDGHGAGGEHPRQHPLTKAYYRIGEVAHLLGVEPHVLRYWEREFASVRPTKSARGQRVYSKKDVELLFDIRRLLYEERFTLAGAKRKLRAVSSIPPIPSIPPQTADEPLSAQEVPRGGEAIRVLHDELAALLGQVQAARQHWD